jgi:hypothetical protein
MNRWAWVGIGAGLFAVVAWAKRGGFVSANVRELARAIAYAEGFHVPNTIPAKRNNPGDLKSGGVIATFANAAEGWEALERQLMSIVNGSSRYYSLNMTIAQMGETWAPSSDGNTAGAWARNVAGQLGVSVNTRLSQVIG